jgi:hypothetical protein
MSNDLEWGYLHLLNSDGVLLLSAQDWEIDDVSVVTVYTNACLTRLGIHILDSDLGFWGKFGNDLPSDCIYYWELWAVVTAVHYTVTDLNLEDEKLVIFTDNSNTVVEDSIGVKIQNKITQKRYSR